MEKFRTSATIVTFHLFKQAICSTCENPHLRKWHTCNYCDFASLQAGDLRAHVKTHNRRNDKYATNVTLHLFKQAMWGDMWKQTFQKIAHMQLMWLCICSNRRFENHNWKISPHMFKQAIWRDMWTLTRKKIAHATCVTLPLFKQANWEDKDMCNITFGKIAHMQLMWLMWLFK